MDNTIIRKYLANELSPEERNAFEQEMEADEFLKEAVEGLEALKSNHPESDADAIQVKLNERIDAAVQKKGKGKLISLRGFKLAIAASVIGVMSLITYRMYHANNQFDEQEIYACYFKPLTHPDGTVRGENEMTEEKQAVGAYEKENYFEAVNHYQQLVKDHPKNTKNNLFYGISLLATNQPKKAADVLSKITTSEEFHYDIHWYLALAHIKNKDLESAKTVLLHLADEENYYQKKAAEILDKLNGHLASTK
jgi:predicted Zn-dependent protease